ncbi:GGDEF domain-containing protein [Nocardia niigatensis]
MNVGWLALRRWWREPVDYRWVLTTLRNHSALDLLKNMIGTCGLGLGVIAVMVMSSPEGPQSTFGRTVIGLFGILGVLTGLRWYLLPWPSASASLALIAVADVAITTTGLLVSSRVALVNATALILTGAYLTLFHGAKALAAHAGWSLLSVLLVTIRMQTHAETDGDIPLAVATTLIMVLAVVFVLPMLQFFYWVLRTDALSDPLTALSNRRGLDYDLPRFFEAGTPICALIIDLDQFKVVNDTFGHQEGDRVLARTAARLRDTADPGAAVARTGGEEFTIVDHLDAMSARTLAERIRRAVEDSSEVAVGVTASIGVAVFERGEIADDRSAPEELLGCADTAMYLAKERGGNTVVVHELRDPLA